MTSECQEHLLDHLLELALHAGQQRQGERVQCLQRPFEADRPRAIIDQGVQVERSGRNESTLPASILPTVDRRSNRAQKA